MLDAFRYRKAEICRRCYNIIRGGVSIFEWLRDLLEIYTWWELWLVASIPSVIVLVWLVFSYFLEIQNSILRTASIWTLLVLLMLGAGTVDAIRRRGNK